MAYTRFVEVEWDRAKDLANQRKHGVGFEEASELFRSGVDYLEIFDDDPAKRIVSSPLARFVAA